MLDQNTRTAILKLREKGHGTRKIARASRYREKRWAGDRDRKRGGASDRATELPSRTETKSELHTACKDTWPVHEELVKEGRPVVPGLTAFCRRHGIGHEAPLPAGATNSHRGRNAT